MIEIYIEGALNNVLSSKGPVLSRFLSYQTRIANYAHHANYIDMFSVIPWLIPAPVQGLDWYETLASQSRYPALPQIMSKPDYNIIWVILYLKYQLNKV